MKFIKNFKKAMDYVKTTNPDTGWAVLMTLITTKEGLRLIKWILLAVVVILIYNPDWIVKIKIAIMNTILQLMK